MANRKQRNKKEKRTRVVNKRARQTTSIKAAQARSSALFGYYFVAVIDVLGQRRALQEFRGLPSSQEEMNHFIRAAKQTFGVVEGIRESFRGFYKTYGDSKRVIKHELTPEQERMFRQLRRCDKLIFHGFSDTFFTLVPLGSETNLETAVALNGVVAGLKACSVTMLHALAAGHALRGGIEVGLGAPLKDGDVYGPAISEAHYLESKIAQSPRIVIGNELVEYLGDHANEEGQAPADVYIKGMANHCLEFVSDDGDCKILDYMGEGVRRMIGDDNQLLDDMRNDLIPKAGEFLNETKDRFEALDDEKLAERYQRAISYYSSRQEIWNGKCEKEA